MLFELNILGVLLPFKINSWNRNILDSKFIVYMNVKGVEKNIMIPVKPIPCK